MQRLIAIVSVVVVSGTVGTPVWAANLNLENRSNETISLEIPGVMNPNLSPKSNSGVTLSQGQKVYFKIKGRRALLLEVKDEKDGQTIVVNELVMKRTAEIQAQK